MNFKPVLLASLSASLVILSACSQTGQRAQPETEVRDRAYATIAMPEPADTPEAEHDEAAVAEDRVAGGAVAELRARELLEKKAEAARRPLHPAPALSIAAPQISGMPVLPPTVDRENYAPIARNAVVSVIESPVSTFSLDVDTGSYSNVRRFLNSGQLPPRDAVRVEELINYFDYAHVGPEDRSRAFSLSTEIAPTPWNEKTHLLQVGVRAWAPDAAPVASNLVFLVDVSGSMHSADKLPLVKTALKMLSRQMSAKDRISLVVYAGASGVVLSPTAGNDTAAISAALERLQAGGSTNGGAGIQLAYAMARDAFIEGGVNRVILATDGDFNVGTTRFESLLDLVKEQRKSGIALTTLGFGQGNYNDHLMEQLADAGDGNHAYIDSAAEAHKVLVRQRNATLVTVARDVKIQVEFNPAQVAEYRLIGYENRSLEREDFDNDKVDAGEIGAGHSVTALYEIALKGGGGERLPPLRYGKRQAQEDRSGEIAHLRLRYKPMDVDRSQLIERPLHRAEILASAERASEDFRLSAAVSAFGQLLAGDVHLNTFDYTQLSRLAAHIGDDPYGDKAGFRQLVELAGSLSQRAARDGVQIGG